MQVELVQTLHNTAMVNRIWIGFVLVCSHQMENGAWKLSSGLSPRCYVLFIPQPKFVEIVL